MMDSFEATPPGVNGSAVADTPSETAPPVEALLFNAGVISADQLGALVRDAVLTKRPVAALAVERGFATPEMLAALQPGAGHEAAPPAATAPAPTSPPEPQAEPAEIVLPKLAAPVVATEPAPAPTRPVPLGSVDPRIQEAVAAHAPTHAPVPAAPAPAMQTVAPPAPAPVTTTFTVFVHLGTGERLAAETAATFESAAEVARSLAGQFARATEWPLIAGRCIRPDAVVSVDIERTLER